MPDALRNAVPTFDAGGSWDAVDAAVLDDGAAIVRGVISPELVAELNADIDDLLTERPGIGLPATGSGLYDSFLGHRTVRLHCLAARFPSAVHLLDDDAIYGWAERLLAPVCASPLLNTGELIEIGPGEPAQFPHRDTDLWLPLPIGGDPYMVNAIVALTPFTADNGATHVTLGSHRWERTRPLGGDETLQAELEPGDAVLFRGDILHGGGANSTDAPRRGISLSYCAGWLRTVENHQLNVPPAIAAGLPERVQALLAYRSHDASAAGGGVLGLYDNGDPAAALMGIGEAR